MIITPLLKMIMNTYETLILPSNVMGTRLSTPLEGTATISWSKTTRSACYSFKKFSSKVENNYKLKFLSKLERAAFDVFMPC